MVDAVKLFFTHYVDFKGRTSRKHYWLAVLGIILIAFVAGFVCGLCGMDEKTTTTVSGLISLATLLPSIAILVRRLHDINKSGWFIFISLIPLVGGIILLVFMCLPSVDENNQYGPKDE